VQPILIIVLATVSGVPLGLWLRHDLTTLGYRNPDEADLPEPGPRWWVVWTSAVAVGSLAAVAVMSQEPLAYIPLLPLVVVGPWLAAVDFDVLRIPNRALAATAAATVLALVGLAQANQEWRTLLVPSATAAVAGGVFAVVHFATRGGVGFGDVKLATVIGLAVGPLGVGAVWLTTLAGSVAAVVWTKATRRSGPIPCGPSLLLGAWIAVLAGVARSA